MHLLQRAQLESGRWYAECGMRSQVHHCPYNARQASPLCDSTLHFGCHVQILQAWAAIECCTEQLECAPAVKVSSIA